MVLRYVALSATLLAACLAAGSHFLAREPADPCVATPEIHACAVFLQPEWLVQRAQAGRAIAAPAIHDSAAITADVIQTAPTTTGTITVSDGVSSLDEAGSAQEAGL